MLVKDFSDSYIKYEGFEIWDIENMDAFFKGNAIIKTIFENTYKMLLQEFEEKRTEIDDNNMQIIEKVLNQIGDKHFFIFTLHNENHLELIKLQRLKVMNFGVNIEAIKDDHIYIMIMDKKAEYKANEFI